MRQQPRPPGLLGRPECHRRPARRSGQIARGQPTGQGEFALRVRAKFRVAGRLQRRLVEQALRLRPAGLVVADRRLADEQRRPPGAGRAAGEGGLDQFPAAGRSPGTEVIVGGAQDPGRSFRGWPGGVIRMACSASTAAVSGAPLPAACRAAASSSPAISPAGPSAPSARCHACSSTSPALAASRRCTSRRSLIVISAYRTGPSSGWVNRSASLSRRIRPSSMTSSIAAQESWSPCAARITCSRGSAEAAISRPTRSASADRPRSRGRTRSLIPAGMGMGSPAAHARPRSSSARPLSRA